MKSSVSNTIFIFLLLFLQAWKSVSQCVNPINIFPYNENFELSDGGWTRSNTLHWEWGSIVPGSKSVITSAGQGQRSWVVGGLSGANYSSGNSYLVSPCFDFSSLVNPEISFKLIWETEYNYDGVHLEYSSDGGLNWFIVGSATSNATCEGQNWYNTVSIRFLNYTPAWSGSILPGSSGNCTNGGGSGSWLTAKHKLSNLAGESNVIFRFSFGAGTVCNDYEGFAIDDVTIKEIAGPTSGFTYSCTGNNTVSFLNQSSGYCISSVNWNFGDPQSGAANTSSAESPSHTFSGAGNFQVTQTVNFSNGISLVSNQSVAILGVNPLITHPLLCHGDTDGSIEANVSGGTGNYSYSWNTIPPSSTFSISNLSEGTYTVTVTENGTCPASSSVSLVDPDSIQIVTSITQATCNQNNGSIVASVSGGTGIYSYLWSNNETTSSLLNLGIGNYVLQVQDANGCSSQTSPMTISNVIVPVNVFLGNDTVICNGQTLLLEPGNFNTYLWQDNSVSPTFLVSQSGVYTVEVTNTAGCSGRDEINVLVDCRDVFFPTAFTPDGNGLNEGFGPIGDVASLRNYNLKIFNRWGQLVFQTKSPFEKWSGEFKKNIIFQNSYTWVASYYIYGRRIPDRKGMVTIIK